MIKNIIKRDNTKVPFDAEKLNRWATWATKSDINWSDVAMGTLDQLFEGCSSQDIHQAMINFCVSKGDAKHLGFAARLLRGSIYKEVYGGAPVSFEESYKSLVERGFWQDFNLSTEDLEKIEAVFDPSFDKTYEYTALTQFVDKYAMGEFVNGTKVLCETPQLALMGISLALFQNDSLEHALNFYQIIRERKINIATPIMAAARSGANEFTSCFLSTVDDSLESIAAGGHLAYTLTANRAGVGFEFDVRSIGDVVGQNKCKHAGKLPHYNKLLAEIKSVTQGSRSGAATITFNILDPEFDDLIRLKNPMTPVVKRIELVDYSLAWNNEFLRRVAKNEDWLLISKRDCPELHNAFYEDRQNFAELLESKLKEYGGDKVSGFLTQTVTKPKKFNGKIVKARDLFKDFLKQRQETGRVYCINIDTANDHSAFKQDVIRQSNLCVAPETQILTSEGYTPIAELEDCVVNVWNGQEFSETTVVKTGEGQKLLKVTTSSGQELECTPYHKWYVFDGYGKPCIMKRTHELKEGDKLIKFDLPVIEGNITLEKAHLNGFYTGDGCYHKGKNIVYLYAEKRKMSDTFKKYEHTYYNCQEKQDREVFHMVGLKDKYFVPSSDYTVDSRLEWLAGWLDADGSVYRNGTNEQLVGSSVEKEFLLEVQRMLQTLGVSAKLNFAMEEGYRKMPLNDGSGEMGDFWCQEAYRLLITSYDVYRLMGLGLGNYLQRLSVIKRMPQRDAKQFNKIVSVSDEGRVDDTYCFTEHKRGMGMFNGILTGQCQEVTLPTKGYSDVYALNEPCDPDNNGIVGLCYLLAHDVGRCSDEDMIDVNYYICRALDNILNLTKFPYQSLKDVAQKYRSIGVGVTNLAYRMAKENLKYSSPEGRDFIHRLMERHQFTLLRASAELAKERGRFEWYNRTKFSDGKLCIDTYTKEIDNHHNQVLLQDWQGLREKISRHGLRFVTVSAHMPCESSSAWGYSTNGLYPIRQGVVMKSRPEGLVPFRAPEYDQLKDSYELAWDIETQDLFKVYGIVQKFTCMSISADSYVDFSKLEGGKVPVTKQMQDMLFSQKIGMKTHYYLNSRTEKKHLESTEDSCESCKL